MLKVFYTASCAPNKHEQAAIKKFQPDAIRNGNFFLKPNGNVSHVMGSEAIVKSYAKIGVDGTIFKTPKTRQPKTTKE